MGSDPANFTDPSGMAVEGALPTPPPKQDLQTHDPPENPEGNNLMYKYHVSNGDGFEADIYLTEDEHAAIGEGLTADSKFADFSNAVAQIASNLAITQRFMGSTSSNDLSSSSSPFSGAMMADNNKKGSGKMKSASEYNYRDKEISGKFSDDWDYILNGNGGNYVSRWWNTFSRDWGQASTDDKIQVIQSMIIFTGGRGNIEISSPQTRFIVDPNGEVYDLQPTIQRTKTGESYPHRNDGSIFNNREGLLPNQPKGYYNEYVHPTPGIQGPSPMRIITGQGGEYYFTPDHYGTFIPIK